MSLRLTLDTYSTATSALSGKQRDSSGVAPKRVSVPSSPVELDRVSLSVSASEAAATRAKTSTLIDLSDAESYVSIADNSNSSIRDILIRFDKIATEYDERLLSPDQKAAYQTELTNLFTDLQSVISNSTFNDTSVLSAGTVEFAFDFDGGENSSSTEFLLSVPNIPGSLSSLGISSLTPSSFESNPSGTRDRLEAAITITDQSDDILTDRASQIDNFASSIGLMSGNETEYTINHKKAEELASTISSLLSDTLSEVNTQNPATVSSLLAEIPSVSSRRDSESDE